MWAACELYLVVGFVKWWSLGCCKCWIIPYLLSAVCVSMVIFLSPVIGQNQIFSLRVLNVSYSHCMFSICPLDVTFVLADKVAHFETPCHSPYTDTLTDYNNKVFLCLISHCETKTCEGLELNLHLLLTRALDGDELSVMRYSPFIVCKIFRYPLEFECPMSGCSWVKNMSVAAAGIRRPNPQPSSLVSWPKS